MTEHEEKIRSLIQHLKSRADQLTHEGVDRDSLATHVADLEKAHAAKASPSVMRAKLKELQAEIESGAGKPNVQSLLALLNEIFATGVPSPDAGLNPDRR